MVGHCKTLKEGWESKFALKVLRKAISNALSGRNRGPEVIGGNLSLKVEQTEDQRVVSHSFTKYFESTCRVVSVRH